MALFGMHAATHLPNAREPSSGEGLFDHLCVPKLKPWENVERPADLAVRGAILRKTREECVKIGLREASRQLEISAPHLTDIEYGRRMPSEALLLRIADLYQIPVPTIRYLLERPDPIIKEIASATALLTSRVPKVLRLARGFNDEQWEQIIAFAQEIKDRAPNAVE